MDENNFYIVFNWMIKELGLVGSELLVYAVIYGFSQDGQSAYFGGLEYLAKLSGMSRRTAMRVLDSLEEKKLIIKDKSVGNRSASYRIAHTEKSDEVKEPILKKEAKKDVKQKYGQGNVMLTDREVESLKKEVADFEGLVKVFSERKEAYGYKYKSDYIAIKRWGIKAWQEQQRREPTGNIYNQKGAYDDF